VLTVREAVTKALEDARNDKVIGKSQEALVRLTVPASTRTVLAARGDVELAELFIVARVELVDGDDLAVEIAAAEGEKCPRCWNIRTLGVDPTYSDVCGRCATVLDQAAGGQ